MKLTDALFADFRPPYPIQLEHAEAYCLGRSKQAFESKDPDAGNLWRARAKASAAVAEVERLRREWYEPALLAAREEYTPERFAAAVRAYKAVREKEAEARNSALHWLDVETHGSIWYAADPDAGAVKVRCKGGVIRLFETGEVVEYPERALRQYEWAAAQEAARLLTYRVKFVA